MTVAGHDLFHEKLKEMRARIRQEIGVERQRQLVLADTTRGGGNDPEDDAQSTVERETSMSVEGSLSAMLAEVDLAFERYADGTYGTCTTCGQPIPLERLEILPQATLCVTCKVKGEHAARAQV